MKNCPVCKTAATTTAKFCQQCGANISNIRETTLYCAASGKAILPDDRHFICFQCTKRFLEQYSYSDRPICTQCAFETKMAHQHRQEYQTIREPKSEMNWIEKQTGIEFIWIPSGGFEMGDIWDDNIDSEPSVQRIEVPGFWLGKYPVTQKQFKMVTGENPSCFRKPEQPVETVSWYDTQTFIHLLQQMTKKHFRLPSESEWEYSACNRGILQEIHKLHHSESHYLPYETAYSRILRPGWIKERWAGTSDENQLANYAWFGLNSCGRPHSVGQLQPNNLGLHDMSGNVWEWCEDKWHDSLKGVPDDGTAWSEGGDQNRNVARGGSWDDLPRHVRISNRMGFKVDSNYAVCGFRLVYLPEPGGINTKE